MTPDATLRVGIGHNIIFGDVDPHFETKPCLYIAHVTYISDIGHIIGHIIMLWIDQSRMWLK